MYDVSNWLPAIGSNALNWKDSYYKHVGQIGEKEIGMFCRSNSGNKKWAGQIIHDSIDIETIKQQILWDELLFLAPRIEISREWRAWMIDGKCVAITPYANEFCDYRDDGSIPDQKAAADYAEWIADQMYEPDDMYVIDIAYNQGEHKVVEYNSYSTSGWYDIDAENLVKATIDYLSR